MKSATNVIDRVEDYRYHTGSVGDVRELTLPVLAVRLNAFRRLTDRIAKASKKSAGGPNNKRTRKRLR